MNKAADVLVANGQFEDKESALNAIQDLVKANGGLDKIHYGEMNTPVYVEPKSKYVIPDLIKKYIFGKDMNDFTAETGYI